MFLVGKKALKNFLRSIIFMMALVLVLPQNFAQAVGELKLLSDSANYDVRFDGVDYLGSDGAIVSGDVNGDGIDDIVVGTFVEDYNGTDSGSVWVIFGGQEYSGDLSLSTSTSYNIRYDGTAGDNLSRYGSIDIGDVNGDGLGDLIIGAPFADNNGTDSGSAYVIFSTLIDDVGSTTGNNKALSTSTNYNGTYGNWRHQWRLKK